MKKTLQFLFLSLISVTAFAQSSNGFGPAEGQSIALGSQVTVDIFMRFDKAWAERDYETLKSYVDEKATMRFDDGTQVIGPKAFVKKIEKQYSKTTIERRNQ